MKFKDYDINIKNIDEESLLNVICENNNTAKLMRTEVDKLRKIAEEEKMSAALKHSTIKEETIVTLSIPTQEKLKDERFEEEINYYLSELNDIQMDELKEKFEDALPSRSNKRYKKILLRLKAEHYKKIKEINDLVEQSKYDITLDDLKTFKENIKLEKAKIKLIEKNLNKKKSKEKEKQVENRMIFVPTSGGNIRVLDEISSIPIEYYPEFIELFNSIKDGTLKNIKKFHNYDDLNGIYEVRGLRNGTRVVIDRLDKNTFAIITAFFKKCNGDKAYHESLKIKTSNYKRIKEQLINSLNNKEFLMLHEDYKEDLYRILGEDKTSKSQYKKEVK